MPIWTRCILMLWITTLVFIIFTRLWGSADRNLERIVNDDYPPFIHATGYLIVFSIIAIIPFFAWLIFLQ